MRGSVAAEASRFLLALLPVAALAVGGPASAMIEYGPLAQAAAEEAGCREPEVKRLGNEGAAIIYAMTCADGSAVSDGRIRCELQDCELEGASEPPPNPSPE